MIVELPDVGEPQWRIGVTTGQRYVKVGEVSHLPERLDQDIEYLKQKLASVVAAKAFVESSGLAIS